jgi:hypothetical protein
MLCGISPGFPELFPTRGQVVTCYSPGRHFTHGLLHFLVRLACVRHAASVDSEPGSNSRLKPEVGLGRPTASAPLRDRDLICEYVQTLSPNISNKHHHKSRSSREMLTSHDWHVQPFVKDRLAFPPERCVFSPYWPAQRQTRTSSKPFKPIRPRNRCQPAGITGFPLVFNRSGSFPSDRIAISATHCWGTLYSALENALPQRWARNRRTPKRKTAQ